MRSIRIGGVPEHFNLPWHLAIEEGLFSEQGIDLSFKVYPGGTGAMNKGLREGEIDMAIILTEGVVTDIINGNPSRIVSQYITSPLVWGVHVHAGSSLNDVQQLNGSRFSISRKGSGSHLMTYVYAQSKGWDPEEQKFVIVKNLEGAREFMSKEESDILLWEKYTTKPLVDSGEWRRVDEILTPWPCFVIAATEKLLSEDAEAVSKLIQIIQKRSKHFVDDRTQSEKIVAERMKLKPEDVSEWFSITRWAEDTTLKRSTIMNIQNTLFGIGVIDRKIDPADLVHPPLLF